MTASVERDPRLRLKIVAAYAAIYLIWGSTFLVVRLGVLEQPPLLFAGARFLFAGTLLALVSVLLRERFPVGAREWRWRSDGL